MAKWIKKGLVGLGILGLGFGLGFLTSILLQEDDLDDDSFFDEIEED